MTNSQDAGGVTESLLNISQDLGNSTAPDVKQQINKFSELDRALESYLHIKRNNGGVCSIKKMFDVMPEKTQDRLNKLMENKDIPSSAICQLLKTFDLAISVEVMRRHRRRKSGGGCACP